jgi:hypothetical protein
MVLRDMHYIKSEVYPNVNFARFYTKNLVCVMYIQSTARFL